jgi:hypothetical protein
MSLLPESGEQPSLLSYYYPPETTITANQILLLRGLCFKLLSIVGKTFFSSMDQQSSNEILFILSCLCVCAYVCGGAMVSSLLVLCVFAL